MKRISIVVLSAIALALLPSCKDMGSDVVAPPLPPPVSQTNPVSFQGRIVPILQRYGCVSCHGGSGGLFVVPYARLMQGGNDGPVIVPGQSDNSLMIKKLTLSVPPVGVRMPEGGPYLPDSTIQVVRDWINGGAQNN